MFRLLRNRRSRVGSRGFALIEALVTVALFAVIGLAFAKSLILGMSMRQRMLHRSAALQIASDEMERQARLRATALAAGVTTTTVTIGTMKFQRVVTITSVSGGGFDVTILVKDLNSNIGSSVQLQNTLVPYGST